MGFFGDMFGGDDKKVNRQMMEWVMSLIELKPTDRVLEIGFGVGTLLQMASKKVTKNKVTGIEISAKMVKAAAELNADAIKAGRMEVLQSDANTLKYENDTFDKAFAVNVVYFWPSVRETVNEICRVIKPGGTIALYLAPKLLMEQMKKERFGQFTLHEPLEIKEALQRLGFMQVRIEKKKTDAGMVHCVLGVQT